MTEVTGLYNNGSNIKTCVYKSRPLPLCLLLELFQHWFVDVNKGLMGNRRGLL